MKDRSSDMENNFYFLIIGVLFLVGFFALLVFARPQVIGYVVEPMVSCTYLDSQHGATCYWGVAQRGLVCTPSSDVIPENIPHCASRV